jgi:hypothetical protein
MRNSFFSSIVGFLGLGHRAISASAGEHKRTYRTEAYSDGEWDRQLPMLDRAGLSLPLYAGLLRSGECARIPRRIVAALERRRRDNAERMRGMLESFGEAARALMEAEVCFACVKGFSLIPEFAEEPWQRHQVDFDFLVDAQHVSRAQSALEKLGYRLAGVSGSEYRLRIPPKRALGHDAYLYAPQEAPAAELHSRFWEPDTSGFDIPYSSDIHAHVELACVDGVVFPRLSRPHVFLYQLLHVFRHFMGSWARPLWVYEIAAYLSKFRDDERLWDEVRSLIMVDRRMRDACALVLLMAQEIFGCPLPAAMDEICASHRATPIGIWVRSYARRWLCADMPGNKLSLLLHPYFMGRGSAWRSYVLRRLAPRAGRPQLCEGIDSAVAKSLQYRIANARFRAGRLSYHLRAAAGYAIASVGWRLRLRPDRNRVSFEVPQRSES